MRRWVVAAGLGVALAGCILLPLGTRDAVPDPRHRLEVTHDAADLTVDADGDLTVREVLDVEVLGNREYTFYRSIDRDDPADPRVRRDVTDLRVTRDGSEVHHVERTTSSGRYDTVVIGSLSPPHLSRGTHRYVISYRMAHVLDPGTTYPTRFDWPVVPDTFNEPVDAADVAVHLPGPAADATCSAPQGGACAVTGQGTSDLAVHAHGLPRLAQVRLDAGLSIPPPPGPARLPWTMRVAAVLGPSVPGLIAVLALTLLAALAGLVLARGAFERRPPVPDDAQPPDDVGPAAAAYVAHEHLDHKAFVATLFFAAQKRLVRLDRPDNRWRVTGLMDDDAAADSDVAVALTAFLGGPQGTFTARRGDASAYSELHLRLRDMERATRDWCVRAGYLRRTGPGRGMSVVLIGLAVFAAFFASLTRLTGGSISGLVPVAFAAGALPLLGDGAATQRTRRGRELASRLGGLRRTFTSPAAAGLRGGSREDLYAAFLPWAVMTGCLDPWTRRFREGTGIRPPVPAYLAGATSGPEDLEAVVLDFSRALEARRRRVGPDAT